MALAKTWAGVSQTDATTTAGDYSVADHWEPISLVNALYRWLASGSGSDEYYLDLAGGGDPGVVEPANVQELIAGVRTNLAAGTAGALTAGQWDYADNDTLGYSTIYVRLTSGAVDPDSRDDKHLTLTAIPAAGDDVRIPAKSTQAITAGLDQSGVAIADFIVEKGFSKAIAGEDAYLQIDCDRFEFSGLGESYIDLGSANISPQVFDTAAGGEGERGLYLLGSNLATLAVQSGSVGVAVNHGELSTLAAVNAIGEGASAWLGAGVTLTTWRQLAGDHILRCAATTANVFDGLLTTEEEGAITNLNAYGGQVISNSAGTVANVLIQGGEVDTTQNGRARTCTNVKVNSGRLLYDPSVLTITNWTTPDFPVAHTVELP